MSQFRVDIDPKGHLNLTDSQCQQTIIFGELQYLTLMITYSWNYPQRIPSFSCFRHICK